MSGHTFIDRAWVGRKHIIPITSKPEVKKRSQRWVQANDEMKEYQRQLALLYPDAKQQVKKTDHVSSFWSVILTHGILRYFGRDKTAFNLKETWK